MFSDRKMRTQNRLRVQPLLQPQSSILLLTMLEVMMFDEARPLGRRQVIQQTPQGNILKDRRAQIRLFDNVSQTTDSHSRKTCVPEIRQGSKLKLRFGRSELPSNTSVGQRRKSNLIGIIQRTKRISRKNPSLSSTPSVSTMAIVRTNRSIFRVSSPTLSLWARIFNMAGRDKRRTTTGRTRKMLK